MCRPILLCAATYMNSWLGVIKTRRLTWISPGSWCIDLCNGHSKERHTLANVRQCFPFHRIEYDCMVFLTFWHRHFDLTHCSQVCRLNFMIIFMIIIHWPCIVIEMCNVNQHHNHDQNQYNFTYNIIKVQLMLQTPLKR